MAFVKICGLSTAETVDAAVVAGASAVGFVFAAGSPRLVSVDSARALVERVPVGVETVGVFRNQPVESVIEIARSSGVTTVQLHGDEPLADLVTIRAAGFGTIRALRVGQYLADRRHYDTERLLLDSDDPGSGQPLDAGLLRDAPAAWILAGGLDPQNVADRIRATGATGVDVSSGVESSRGVKDVALIRAFVAAARGASLEHAEDALLAAMRVSDVDALDRLIADSLTFTLADGSTIDKAADLDAHRTGRTKFLHIDELERHADASGNEGSTEVLASAMLLHESQKIEATLRWRRAWRIIDGRWQVVEGSVAVEG